MNRLNFRLSLVLTLILSCCLSYNTASAIGTGQKMYNEAEELFLKEDYTGAAERCERLIMQGARGRLKDNTQHLLGLSFIKLRRYKKAREVFISALSSSSDTNLLDDFHLGIGDTYLLEGNFIAAKDGYEKILKLYPKSGLLPIVIFRLGQCSLKMGNWNEAVWYLEKVKKEYATGFEAKLAGEILANKEFYFAVQVGAFERYANAKKLCEKLLSKGYPAYVSKGRSRDKSVHRVRVGKCDQREEAQKLKQALEAEGLPGRIYP